MTSSGLWNVPGSMIYFPMNGLRRFIPVSWRVKRVLKGLQTAAREKRVFHLWFHPTNLAEQQEAMFFGLQCILESADRMRSQGELDVCAMRDVLLSREDEPRKANSSFLKQQG